MKICKHKWKQYGRTAIYHKTKRKTPTEKHLVYFRCDKCQEEKSRRMSVSEWTRYKAQDIATEKECEAIHHLWHKFYKLFINEDGSYKYWGWEFIQKVEKFAEKNTDVEIAGCDDSYFSSSVIVCVPHKGNQSYMGTTVVFIPQMSGPPCEIFLYPGHRINLIEVLKKMK